MAGACNALLSSVALVPRSFPAGVCGPWWAAALRLFRAASLTLLAAELYNILAFHLTMAPGTITPALVACVLWILVFLQYRERFRGIFSAKPAT